MRGLLIKTIDVTTSVTVEKGDYKAMGNIAESYREGIENPRVVGSIPTPATIFIFSNEV